MRTKLCLALAASITMSAFAHAATKSENASLETNARQVCSDDSQSKLERHALECFQIDIDLSAFNLKTAKGVEAAEKRLGQIAHATCRIRNPSPTSRDVFIYENCRANILKRTREHYGLD